MDTTASAQAGAKTSSTHPDEHSVFNKTKAINLDEPVKISIILSTSSYFLSGLRDFTKAIVQNVTGFSERWAYRFQSVVDELVNNAIEFGSAPGKDIKITFLSIKNKYIEIFVEDTGTGHSKKSAAEMMAFVKKQKGIDPASITTLRGRGLTQIVSSWTDVLEFKDNEKGGLTVHVVKNLEPGENI
jgi:anti-sigma regulatory factor (Ser/Thr protein kinase)